MPLYEYQCDACGHRFEVIRKFSDTPLTECPQCAGAVRKLPSSPAIQFKGTGWYITDYARKGGNGASSGESSAKSEGNASAESGAKAEGAKTEGPNTEGANTEGGAKAEGGTKRDASTSRSSTNA